MKTAILADSTCDLSAEQRERLGISIVPLTVSFDDRAFLDNIDLTHTEFFRLLRKCDQLPSTSQPSPAQFETVYREALERCDQVVMLSLSSGVSSTYSVASTTAAAIAPERIHVVDTLTGSYGAALHLMEAVRLRDAGASAAEIAEVCRDLAARSHLYVKLDTLRYLKKGGRLSGAAAVLGGVMGVKPILQTVDGRIEAHSKTRGEEASKQALLQILQEGNVDPRYGVALAHADAPDRLEEYRAFFAPYLEGMEVYTGSIGCVIGTHSGPGAVGLAFVSRA